MRAVRVPMREPHQTASGAVAESPLVLTDAQFDDGTVGHSVVFTYTPLALQPVAELVRNFAALVQGEPLAPVEIEQKLARRFRLLGTQGLVGMALAAIDMALWDALARCHRTSLAQAPGRRREAVPGLRRGRLRRSPALRAGGRGLGEARIHRRQGQDRLSDGGGGRRRRPRDEERGGRQGLDHGRLQPVPHARRGRAEDARARRRGARVGRGADARARLTPDTRASRARRQRRSSAARTGGDRSICSTRSTRRRRITSCPT